MGARPSGTAHEIIRQSDAFSEFSIPPGQSRNIDISLPLGDKMIAQNVLGFEYSVDDAYGVRTWILSEIVDKATKHD